MRTRRTSGFDSGFFLLIWRGEFAILKWKTENVTQNKNFSFHILFSGIAFSLVNTGIRYYRENGTITETRKIPRTYSKEAIEQIKQSVAFSLSGLNDSAIAKKMGKSASTIYRWRRTSYWHEEYYRLTNNEVTEKSKEKPVSVEVLDSVDDRDDNKDLLQRILEYKEALLDANSQSLALSRSLLFAARSDASFLLSENKGKPEKERLGIGKKMVEHKVAHLGQVATLILERAMTQSNTLLAIEELLSFAKEQREKQK